MVLRFPKTPKSNRGALFTLTAIVILTLFATTYTTHTLFEDRTPLNNRIQTLNNFLTSTEQDLQRQTYISTYRAIFLLNKKIVETYEFIPDLELSINELFYNATLDGANQDLMQEATFSEIETFLQQNAAKINADITLENPTLTLTQTDPWNIKATLVTTLTLDDVSNLATWNKTITTTTYIPITNFDDPLYSSQTQGKVLHRINQTPYQTFVSGADYTNLQTHFQNSLYIHSTSAPSYLMRLQGNLSASPQGIESLVNPQTLADAGISAKYKTVIDYIYFSTDDPAKYTIPSVPNLILDDQDNHLEIYNVSGAAIPA